MTAPARQPGPGADILRQRDALQVPPGECVEFSKAAGYRSIMLWTNDVLDAARHIYQSFGFELIEEEPHHSFGKDLVGQVWRLDL